MITYVKLFMTACFWGGTFIAGKAVAGSVHPFCAAFLRFAVACLFLVVMTRYKLGRLPKPDPGQLVLIALLGASGVFAYNIFFFTGLKYINAGSASLIIATNPILISTLSAILFRERMNLVKITGLVCSVSGAMLVISDGRLSSLIQLKFGAGEILICGCVLSWVTYSLLGMKVMARLSPIAAVCYSSIAGMIFLFFPAVYQGLFSGISHYRITDWASLFYLGFFGTVLGFFWYYEGIEKIGPAKSSVFINFVPVSAIVLSFFILHEPVTLSLLTGGLMVITGVYLTNASTPIMNFIKRRSAGTGPIN